MNSGGHTHSVHRGVRTAGVPGVPASVHGARELERVNVSKNGTQAVSVQKAGSQQPCGGHLGVLAVSQAPLIDVLTCTARRPGREGTVILIVQVGKLELRP